MEDPRTPPEKERFMAMLRRRYNLVKSFIKANPHHPVLDPMPFNSGYFMSFRCTGISAETLRSELLAKHGVGVIALGDHCVRVAFSSIDEEKITETYQIIYDTAQKLHGG
jgi:DNA-binding transcriptional MocR family regulator